ncbi:MAG TPA: ABC transporter ATP-binding protein [Firmicutes bacterium]|jgi:ATP-binding cassette subfamily B protein|nr:ABC transporter ATP-binding protein [Candidatus Fermentithermobacillaceae bacterium]
MACALAAAAITLVFPLLTRYITKTVLAGDLTNALGEIYKVAVLMVGLVAVQMLCNYIFDYYGHAMGAQMESDLRLELFEHLQRLPLGFYDEARTGELMSRLTNDLFSLAEMYHHCPEDIVLNSVKFVGAGAILLTINWKLTLVVLLFLPVVALFAFGLSGRMHRARLLSKERIGAINAQVEDSLAGIRLVKSFTGENLEIEKFARENRSFLASRKDIYRNESYFSQGIGALVQLITVAVVICGGVNIIAGSLDLADLITFLLYIGHLVQPVIHLTHMVKQYQDGITGFERFMEIMAIEPDTEHSPTAVELSHAKGDVEFRKVSFKYRDSSDYVLKDLSFSVQAGEYVAVVGTSGVGKTTLCSLMSIARVFLKNPPVLIFDEATSALDSESERVVQDSLEGLAKNRTTFVIAHRLSTIRKAQRIIVLGNEGIVEQGTHEELLRMGGTYARLHSMQFAL